jgi:DinB superfamily
MEKATQLTIKSCVDAWTSYSTRVDRLFDELSDDQLQKEIAPGRNTGIYLMGHLAAVHDNLFPLLGIGEKLQPAMHETFVEKPDKSELKKPPVQEIRNYWKKVHRKLSDYITNFTPDEWLQKHTSISEEDFLKEPHRNRLNVLVNRTNHLAYHYGQLVLLK